MTQQTQQLLDSFGGSHVDLGFFIMDGHRKVYSCSIRQFDGALAYGTGATLEEAIEGARSNEPIRSERAA